jgi:multidrug resistance protein, MATE family
MKLYSWVPTLGRGLLVQGAYLQEAKQLLGFSLPLVVNGLVISAMNMADLVMAGQIGRNDLAAVGLGSSLWLLFALAFQGVLSALSPIVAQLRGRGEKGEVPAYLSAALKLAAGTGIAVTCACALLADTLLDLFGVQPEFKFQAAEYLKAISWGAPALASFLAIRFVLEGLGHTRAVLALSLLALAVKLAVNAILVFGLAGFHKLGSTGCAIGSVTAMWTLFLAAAIYCSRVLAGHGSPALRVDNSKRRAQEVMRLGLPIAGSTLAEHGFFAMTMILVARISVEAAAAHQIALACASVLFMIPSALASGTAVRVGLAAGSHDYESAARRGYVGMITCGLLMMVASVALAALRSPIAELVSGDATLVPLAATFIVMAACFQVFDGLQLGALGALRGLKDTRIPFLISMVCYWLIGLPTSTYFAIHSPDNPSTIWIGFVAALSVAALLFVRRFARLVGRYRNPNLQST